jgi:putative chitinase
LLIHPEILEEPEYAVLSAIWFWHIHDLNELADKDNLKAITKIINGGYNGLTDRQAFLTKVKEVIK